MSSSKKRVRDPVHGLITFDFADEVDRIAWRLIDTPEFQRLRRVKQLGVSEFTFPGATHTRFAHSIGVFHVARGLMKIAEMGITDHTPHRMRVALFAALLHDIGHGPFSHAFEAAEKSRLQNRPGLYKDHEHWTAEIIASKEHGIRRVLAAEYGGGGGIADDIAALLTSDPSDIYAAVVSSSFDADRLDYLRRDRMMTGSGAGAIDFEWLLDNLRVVDVRVASDEGDVGEIDVQTVQTFAFEEKALQAVEAFILARYHLYSQVYMHRVTRGIEQVLTAFLRTLAEAVTSGTDGDLPLQSEHPLVRYYSADVPTLELYLALDDTVIWSAIEMCAARGSGRLQELALCIRDRKVMKALPIDLLNPMDQDRARRTFIDGTLKAEIGKSIFVDRAPLSVYKDSRRENVKPHKRVHIRRADGTAVDVASLSRPIAALADGEEILRYYFVNENVRQTVLAAGGRQ